MEWLPILFALACPLMMIFMMFGGHGHGHGHKHKHREENHIDNGGIQSNELNEKLLHLELENRNLREELNEIKSVFKKEI